MIEFLVKRSMTTDRWNLFSLFIFKVCAPFKDVDCNLLFVVGRSLLDTEWKGSWPTVEILTLNRLRKVIRCLRIPDFATGI
jgi:hypothetical protein